MSLAIYLQYKEKRLLFINGETHWVDGLCYGKDCILNPPIFHLLLDMTPAIKVWRQPYLRLFENGIIAWRGCHEHIADKLLECMLFLGEETLAAIIFERQWGPVLKGRSTGFGAAGVLAACPWISFMAHIPLTVVLYPWYHICVIQI